MREVRIIGGEAVLKNLKAVALAHNININTVNNYNSISDSTRNVNLKLTKISTLSEYKDGKTKRRERRAKERKIKK